jgi:hypothetical protein
MIKKWFKVNACDIILLQFIIEGHEGMATVSTINPEVAIMQVLIMPSFAQEAFCLLQYLSEHFPIKEIPFETSQVILC